MPNWITWIATNSATTATTYTQAMSPLMGQTVPSTAQLYFQQVAQTATTTALSQCFGLGNTISTGGAIQAANGWIFYQEQDVHHSQYIALAQQRVVITEERRAQIERERQQALRAQEEIRLARERSEMRARDLLLAHLTKEQRRTFEANNWFVVKGGKTKTEYKIRGYSYSGNIHVLDRKGNTSHRLCAHCQSHIPLGDQLLAQKISLECDEEYFLRIANRHAA